MSIESTLWDCIMVGGGPTALSAAVYTAREDIKTLIVEKAVVGGLAAITDRVDNYPGFAEGVAGLELADQLQKQAVRFGARIELDEVTRVVRDGGQLRLDLVGGQSLAAKTVLVATGSEWKKLSVEGEAEFYGRGIHNCATCDGAFYRDKKLVVVGGGNSAAQESLFLTKFAREIDILIRRDAWRASDVLVKRVEDHPKINVLFKTIPLAFRGQSGKLDTVEIETDSQKKTIATDGVFVFIGLRPVTGFLADSGVALDDSGFVITDDGLQTNVDGIFCAGDVRAGATMQIASAVGEGATAALSISHYLDEA